ncbi:hypothetical protein [Intrasporangium mesophilum]
MTIDEAVHRILGSHWLIILSCILVPLSATLLLGKNEADLYEAVARVQMGRDLAASNVQADATSQRVLGIATSPGVVRIALDKAGLQADASTFATDHIDVRRVGVSPVMEIAVTDTSPHRAAIIASSLTSDVIQFSNVGDQQTVEQRRSDVQKQLAGIKRQRDQLVSKLATASPGNILAIQAQLSALTSSEAEYQRQLSDLDVALLSSSKAVLLDAVRQPTIPLPKEVLQKGVLVALIGTLLGLGLAAALETLRPRLPSPRAIARALDVPHVGHLPVRDLSARTATAAEQAADRLALLGHRYEAQQLFVVPVLSRDEAWAGALAERMSPTTGVASHRLECSVLAGEWVDPGDMPVAVILAPKRLKSRDLARATALVDALGWPVLGVMTYEPGRLWSRRDPMRDDSKHEAPPETPRESQTLDSGRMWRARAAAAVDVADAGRLAKAVDVADADGAGRAADAVVADRPAQAAVADRPAQAAVADRPAQPAVADRPANAAGAARPAKPAEAAEAARTAVATEQADTTAATDATEEDDEEWPYDTSAQVTVEGESTAYGTNSDAVLAGVRKSDNPRVRNGVEVPEPPRRKGVVPR